MQAVILAGGLGTRLEPITKSIPKPMVPVAGKPYLEHQLRLLKQQSITDIVLLVGYLASQIEEYFGDGERFGLSVRYSREETPLGTGGALREAQGLLAEQFVLIYGDSYLPIDYRTPAELLTRRDVTGVAVVYDNRLEDTSVASNIALDPDGYVARYDKGSPGDAELRYVEAGVLAFRREVLGFIPPSGAVSLEKEVFPELIARRQLAAHVARERFYDIGSPEKLRAFERFLTR